MESSESEKSES
jgi:hypothetical protein